MNKFSFLALTSTIWTAAVMAGGENQFTDGDEFADFYGQDELVSIATGTSTPISKAPSVASVISAEQIEAMGATHLDEVLERIPGLHVMPSDLNRLDPVYSIRGIQTGFNPQILVLMNGAEVKDYLNGGLPFTFQMPLSNISRIEVIRGPGSAVYGADAYSGVINIITKTAAENEAGAAGFRAGSFQSRDIWVQKGFQTENFEISFSLENLRSDGDDGRIVTADAQTTWDNLNSTNASLAPGALSTHYDVTNMHLDVSTGNWSLQNWFWQQDQGGLGQGGAQALDNRGYQDATQLLSHLNYDRDLSDTLKLEADLSYQRSESDSLFYLFPAGSTLTIGSDGNIASTGNLVTFTDGYIGNPQVVSENVSAELTTLYNGFQDHSLRLSTGWSESRVEAEEHKNYGPGVIDGASSPVDGTLTNVTGTDDIFLQDQTRESYFVSAQDQWQLNNDWSFTAGIRWDQFEDFGNATTPRLALVWEPLHNLTTKLLYGEAFRAPSFAELYFQNNPSALGNPNLKPEEIKTWELALDYRPSFETGVKLSFFNYEATDLIAIVAQGSTRQYQNARNQDGYGLELELDWDATEALNLNASYAWQHSEDADTGEDVADVPEHTTYLDINYRFSRDWRGSLQHYWVGSRSRAEGDSRPDIDDYHWVNARVTRSFNNDRLKLSIIAKNLFDTDAREPSSALIPGDYPLEGRSIWGEIKYSF
ncbi:TonB-dependent receptor [Pontibacterium granulatum]|uniref:TonB-dependent receptor plug domain-containing protein n=1 Tax=Pontibacterium granulatum TaxID=2036029 RepID=UPI00249AA788|nr:TonB-dependent receptor [Pontibacterium granulatum]MDI3324274.1 TonB-dependent receptor [Pontibacterium granulatum]